MRPRFRAGIRLLASCIALVGSISTTVLMAFTFLYAYFLTDDKEVLVRIDAVGEAHFEFWLLMFFVPFMVYFWFQELVEDAKRWRDA